MINTDECMLWAGYINDIGYGQIFYTIDGKLQRHYAHRLSYESFVGEIPDKLVIDHLCKVRHCINPDHLEPVTARVNTLRGDGVLVNTMKTHCPRGHEYNERNTQYFGKKKWRRCRSCAIERHRQYRAHTL